MCQALEPVGHACMSGALHNPLHARAQGRESFSLTAKPFDPRQKGGWEHTF